MELTLSEFEEALDKRFLKNNQDFEKVLDKRFEQNKKEFEQILDTRFEKQTTELKKFTTKQVDHLAEMIAETVSIPLQKHIESCEKIRI